MCQTHVRALGPDDVSGGRGLLPRVGPWGHAEATVRPRRCAGAVESDEGADLARRDTIGPRAELDRTNAAFGFIHASTRLQTGRAESRDARSEAQPTAGACSPSGGQR